MRDGESERQGGSTARRGGWGGEGEGTRKGEWKSDQNGEINVTKIINITIRETRK